MLGGVAYGQVRIVKTAPTPQSSIRAKKMEIVIRPGICLPDGFDVSGRATEGAAFSSGTRAVRAKNSQNLKGETNLWRC